MMLNADLRVSTCLTSEGVNLQVTGPELEPQ